MDRLDSVEALAVESEYACGVLGNRETSEFILVELHGTAPMLSGSEDTRARMSGMYFAGVWGYRRGDCVMAAEPDLDCLTLMVAAADEFTARVTAYLKSEAGGDWCEWAKALFKLPDSRN